MKNVKRILLLVVLTAALCALLCLTASAETYSGTCGTNVNWSLDSETGVLSITGSGKMASYTSDSPAPWNQYYNAIKTVSVASGVTSIGDYAFSGCNRLSGITMSAGVASVGKYASSGCKNLKYVHFHGTQTDWQNIQIGTNNSYLTNAELSVLVHHAAKAPTCTETGWAAYDTCAWSYIEPLPTVPDVELGPAVEVDSGEAFVKAIWANAIFSGAADASGDYSFRLTAPVNIRLTEDFTFTMSDNAQKNGSPFSASTNRQIVYVMPGSVIDLNGHTLNVNNVKFFFSEGGTAASAEQRYPLFTNGRIIDLVGTATNTKWVCDFGEAVFGGCLTDIHTSSIGTFVGETVSEYIIPAGVTLHTVHTNGSTYDFASNDFEITFRFRPGAQLDEVSPLSNASTVKVNRIFESEEDYCCGYTTYVELPALGHDYKNGLCTRCKAEDPVFDPSTVQVMPDAEERTVRLEQVDARLQVAVALYQDGRMTALRSGATEDGTLTFTMPENAPGADLRVFLLWDGIPVLDAFHILF